ncbi:MAG: ammonia-forming cytochrome c nitrite reductase subunit c552, partial [Elusimicrobiales bacterium]|nr:ammonia-forming cytochrome c nitrite reductase subunit c552 [Elusimicrobiales bacterium]
MKRILFAAAAALALAACTKRAEPIKIAEIKEGTYEPAEWGKVYPLEYERWKKTAEKIPAGKSRYKPGWDTDGKIYDKLSEYPFLALLYKGWGFGIEYNEPRGHWHMLSDVMEVDESRLKAGGVCLTCKTPYAQAMQEEHGKDYFSRPIREVHSWIPKEHRELGTACIQCHDPADMSLRLLNQFTLGKALDRLGVNQSRLSRQEMRSLVCAQCHVTYVVRKDKDMKSEGVFFPWQNSKFGAIRIEDIIKKIKSDPAHLEWTQKVTGFKLGFLRHPEFEMFSNASPHWRAGLACADCHMPLVPSDDAGNIEGVVHDHRFPGANTALPFANGFDEQLDLVTDF